MTHHDALLEEFFAEGTERSAAVGPEYRDLWTSLDAATQGGKRFRPALVAAAYRAFGGTDPALVGRVGAAVELLHTAFVVHDDVIDGDTTRRGRLNVSGSFSRRASDAGLDGVRAATLGRTAGILAGDLALVAAVRMVALCGADAVTTRRLLDLLDHAVQVSAAGELADVTLSMGLSPVSLGAVLTMEEHKTAVYSFELPLQAGAVLAGAPEPVVGRLSELGRLLGIGFQLLDDLQGVFGDEAATGKSVLTDLREGKATPLIAYARSTPDWHLIEPYLGDPTLDDDRADAVRHLLAACGARDFIEDLADGYVTAALGVATDLDLPRDFVSWVGTMTDDFVRRAA